MKNVKRYFLNLTILTLIAPTFVGCNDGLEDLSSQAYAAPSDKFNTQIQFVSRLTDGKLATSEADFTAINNYLVNTLEGKEKSWLTILDRMDGNSNTKVLQAALDTKRWTSFAPNKITNKTSYEGSVLFYNTHSQTLKSTPVGEGAYVMGFNPTLDGTRTDLDPDGKVILPLVKVSFPINFRTTRFDSQDQLNAFGGAAGVMNALKAQNMNFLMVGTVKNDLFESLNSTVTNTDPSFKVFSVAKGSAYTIFLLAEKRFWALNKVEKTTLAGSEIDAYNISIMW